MMISRFARILVLGMLLGMEMLWAQPCAVSLGADTSICAATYNLVPSLSVSMFENSLEIIYDATQGQTGLLSATKVYMHSAAELMPMGGWQNQAGNWGQDDGVGQMTNLGQDRIRILPHGYYNYPANVTPYSLFMVFRNAISGPGTYWLQMTDTIGCMAVDTIVVNLDTVPLVDLGQPAICDGASILLDAGAGYAQYAWSTGASTQIITVSLPGIHSVTVTNSAGCTGIGVVNIPALSAPIAGFFASASLLNVQFVDQSTGGGTYQWDYDSDGTIDATTPGSNSYTYPAMGSYTATLIVTNACGSDTVSQTFYVGEIGFQEAWLGHFGFFPNPTQGDLSLELDLKKGLALTWSVVDVRGAVVMQGNEGRVAGIFRKELDLHHLPAGIYHLLLLADGQPLARSFVKR
jgi:PKD domain